jgi:protein-disulfide isomerase
MSNEKLTRDQQREAARAKARAMRESQKKGEARKKAILIAGSVIAGLAVIVTGFFVVQQLNKENEKANDVPSTALVNGGITVIKDLKVATSVSQIDKTVPTIVIYQDLQCPACQAFEVPNMPQISQLVKDGKYNLEIHPISFLDGASANEYSSRAGSALLCVADQEPEHFLDYNTALYAQQPKENTVGPDNAALANLASSIGVKNQSTLDCIENADWATWSKNQTPGYKSIIPGTNLEFTGTPFVIVNGQHYQGELANAAMFLQWLQTVAPASN